MSPERGRANRGFDNESEDERVARSFSRYAGVGLQFAISIVVFLYAGQWVDRRLGTAPWFLLAGVVIGASAAFYSMYRRLMGDLQNEERRNKR